MKTQAIIEGLTVLQLFYVKADGHNTGADHDVIYAYPTSRRLTDDAIRTLVALGWSQDVKLAHPGQGFAFEDYDPEEGWRCYV